MTPTQSDFPGSATYFHFFREGRYDELSHLQFIYPTDEARFSEDGQSLMIGRPGVDGLEFAFRAGRNGIWVWYPLDDEWRMVAPDINSLEQNWISGDLKV